MATKIRDFYNFLDQIITRDVSDGIIIPELGQLYNNFSLILSNHEPIPQNQISGLIETWGLGKGFEVNLVLRNRVRLLEGYTYVDKRIPNLIGCWTRGKKGSPDNLQVTIDLYNEIFGADFFELTNMQNLTQQVVGTEVNTPQTPKTRIFPRVQPQNKP